AMGLARERLELIVEQGKRLLWRAGHHTLLEKRSGKSANDMECGSGVYGVAASGASVTSLPGLRIPSGSSAPLIARSAAIRLGGPSRSSSARFIWPIPCSAEIDPPAATTMS